MVFEHSFHADELHYFNRRQMNLVDSRYLSILSKIANGSFKTCDQIKLRKSLLAKVALPKWTVALRSKWIYGFGRRVVQWYPIVIRRTLTILLGLFCLYSSADGRSPTVPGTRTIARRTSAQLLFTVFWSRNYYSVIALHAALYRRPYDRSRETASFEEPHSLSFVRVVLATRR